MCTHVHVHAYMYIHTVCLVFTTWSEDQHTHSTIPDEARTAVAVAEREEERREEDKADTTEERGRNSVASDSMVSTVSSSSEELTVLANQRKGWVNFEEEKPPLPPPRAQLEEVTTGAILANPNTVDSGRDPFIDFNPFSRLDVDSSDAPQSGRMSPFEDFGASIAETLVSQSRNRTSLDPYTANLMESAGREIYMALDTRSAIPERRESEIVLPEPLIPTSSSTSVSSLDSNCTANLYPFAPPPLKSASNGFPGSQSHPLTQREWVRPRGPPPPKPQPYSGKPVLALQGMDDPFGNLLGGISMQAYASGPTCSSPAVPSSPQHLAHTPVETPLV